MSALPTALPLALSAALYPPALLTLVLLLSARRPRGLVLAYLAGATLMTVGVGTVGVLILHSTSSSSSNQASSTATGWADIVIGIALLALSRWAWKRHARTPKPARSEGSSQGRIAVWSRRATTSQKWAFGLGLLMFLPSPMYLLAVSDIGAASDGLGSKFGAMLICAVAVMLFVELPAIGMFVRPDTVTMRINGFHAWLVRNGWTLAAGVALVAGVYAIVEGISALT